MKYTQFFASLMMGAALLAIQPVYAAADLDINTPAVQSITQSMKSRTGKLSEYYNSGAVGFAKDGNLVVRDASLVPLPKRQEVSRLVADENQDRAALYREIARANNHPEWESDIRQTFAQRWVQRAQPGWWVQQSNGSWSQK